MSEVKIDDVVRLRKPHPCGGFEWTVVRIGADIGITCNTCGHRVLLARRIFEKRVKALVHRARPQSPFSQETSGNAFLPNKNKLGD